MLLGSIVGATVTGVLGTAAVENGAWRIPFLLGIGVGLCGLYIRRRLAAGVQTEQAPATRPVSPLREAFRTQWRNILRIIGLNALNAVSFYMCFIFVTSYLQRTDHLGASTALDINTAALLVFLATVACRRCAVRSFRAQADAAAVSVAQLVLAWPLFWLLHHPQPSVALAAQLVFAALIGLLAGVIPAAMVELVPRRVRCTAMSLALNLSFAVLGGTVPMVAVYLMSRTGDDLSPAFFLMAVATISLLTTWRTRETAHVPLDGGPRRGRWLDSFSAGGGAAGHPGQRRGSDETARRRSCRSFRGGGAPPGPHRPRCPG